MALGNIPSAVSGYIYRQSSRFFCLQWNLQMHKQKKTYFFTSFSTNILRLLHIRVTRWALTGRSVKAIPGERKMESVSATERSAATSTNSDHSCFYSRTILVHVHKHCALSHWNVSSSQQGSQWDRNIMCSKQDHRYATDSQLFLIQKYKFAQLRHNSAAQIRVAQFM